MKFLKYTAIVITIILGWVLLLPQHFPFEMLIKTFYWFL